MKKEKAMKNPDLIGREAAIKPIPFNAEMVRAILDGRKTQTRRVAFEHDDLREFKSSTYPDGWWYKWYVFKSFDSFLHSPQSPRCFYAPGDILWVKEPWYDPDPERVYVPVLYKADFPMHWDVDGEPADLKAEDYRWKSSTHMPKGFARIFLRVTDVRVERLNDMSEEDAIAEGFADSPAGTDSPLERFFASWDKTIKREDLREYGSHANPWVWVIEFERCEKPEGWCK